VGKSGDSTFRLLSTSVEEFKTAITSDKRDNFAKTFVAKANYQGLWPAVGYWRIKDHTRQLAGAITWTLSKRKPVVANLQLLHTFAAFRRQGVGRVLCNHFLKTVVKDGAEYWRVSAEVEAIPFYESLGIRFLGRQKSGCQLAVARVAGSFGGCMVDLQDPVIRAAVYKKGKGGCVEVFGED
jgi:GNAT superfamily N-acetyltransferase